jgi:putative sugar O-methyltransferase
VNRKQSIALKARRIASPVQGILDRRRGRTSFTDSSGYTTLCARAAKDPDVFRTFKSDPTYTAVLEHVTCAQGAEYLRIALEQSPQLEHLFDRFRENDQLGGPSTCDYGEQGRFSPTTLRYTKVLSDLQRLFGGRDGLDILEIGGGYGGQCFITSVGAPPASYSIVDLPPCLALQRTYLDAIGVKNARFIDPDSLDPSARYDLVISNYAFSECVRAVQERYVDLVLTRAERGYITCNWVNPPHYASFAAEELLDAIPGSRFIPEVPQTGVANAILVWG